MEKEDLSGKGTYFHESPLRLLKVSHFQCREDPYASVWIRFPGLHCQCFDRDKNPIVANAMAIWAEIRCFMINMGPPSRYGSKSDKVDANKSCVSSDPKEDQMFLEWAQTRQDIYCFVTAAEFVFTRSMYNAKLPKWPIDMKHILGKVGNSSVTEVSEAFACDGENDFGSGALLWRNTVQLVAVNKITRKSAKLPDWFKDKYEGRGCLNKSYYLTASPRPEATFVNKTTVQWSDTDYNIHTGWTTYVRWATDALHAALLHRASATDRNPERKAAATSALCGITDKIVGYGMHKIQVLFMSECLEGEAIETHIWQEEGADPGHVMCTVVKEGQDICQIKLWYYTDPDSKGTTASNVEQ